jgi:hypothetical protein
MSDYITVKHSFNSGDLITILPGFQKIYQDTGKKVRIYQRLGFRADYGHLNNHPVKDAQGYQVCMNEEMFYMLQPLIEYQEYIESFRIWSGEEVVFNVDETRQHSQVPLPNGSIHHWASLVFPQLECDLGEPWLKALQGECPYFIVNRTERYRNDYINYAFLKPYEGKIMFAGTVGEWEKFNKEFGLKTQYLWVDNFFQLATHIQNSKGFLGSQSLCWHIADAMKAQRIVEVCQFYPNTFPTGANGRSFITQAGLEYHFDELLKS